MAQEDQPTRERILDAAETLFARRGFNGTSMRDISREAGVPLGLMGYYGSKGDLYAATIRRRSEEHASGIVEAMQAVLRQADGGPVDLRALVKAYFMPVVEKALRGGPGWRSYVQLLATSANTIQSEPHVAQFHESYKVVSDTFIAGLRQSFPAAPDEDVYAAYYLLSSSVTHILMLNGAVDWVSDGVVASTDLDFLAEKMAVLFEAGMAALLRP